MALVAYFQFVIDYISERGAGQTILVLLLASPRFESDSLAVVQYIRLAGILNHGIQPARFCELNDQDVV